MALSDWPKPIADVGEMVCVIAVDSHKCICAEDEICMLWRTMKDGSTIYGYCGAGDKPDKSKFVGAFEYS